MKYTNYFFLFQCLIFCKQFNFSSGKALLGQNVMEATESQFPFLVSISLNKPILKPEHHLCSGTLISKKHVLTCAHCKSNENHTHFCVIAGSNNISYGKRYKIQNWISFLQWILNDMRPMESVVTDISIIMLHRMVRILEFNPATVSLVNVKQLYGSDAVIVGWSYINNTTMNSMLTFGIVKILKPRKCQKKMEMTFEKRFEMYDSILCTATNPYILLNYGDSGGPVLDTNNFIIGINQGRCPKHSIGTENINIHISTYHYNSFIAAMIR